MGDIYLQDLQCHQRLLFLHYLPYLHLGQCLQHLPARERLIGKFKSPSPLINTHLLTHHACHTHVTHKSRCSGRANVSLHKGRPHFLNLKLVFPSHLGSWFSFVTKRSCVTFHSHLPLHYPNGPLLCFLSCGWFFVLRQSFESRNLLVSIFLARNPCS